jgi:hypothetical protein
VELGEKGNARCGKFRDELGWVETFLKGNYVTQFEFLGGVPRIELKE